MLQLALAFGAGVATAASPCILPMLPLLLGASASAGASRWRPLLVVAGFVLSFAGAALLFASSAQALGVPLDALRGGALVLLAGCGLLLLWPALGDRLAARAGGLADLARRWGDRAGAGPAGALLLGASLGLLWTPCAGPVLASVLALVATQASPHEAGGLLLGYAAGAGLPMLALAYGGRAASSFARRSMTRALPLRRAFGGLVLATAAAMATGWDTRITAALADVGPFTRPAADTDIHPLLGQPAPEFESLGPWLNAEPVTLAQLKGRVVLVDFWTYDCINCVRTLPQLAAWHARYAAQGLVVLGVHTPEFAHERAPANVKAAVARLGVRYAVAQDNAWRTWSAWRNRVWPALYLVDREGRIAFVHEGEGDAAAIEAALVRALRR